MDIAARAAADQIAAGARDSGPKVEVSEFEMRALVTLADIGLMLAIAASDVEQSDAARSRAESAANRWNESHQEVMAADMVNALYASVLLQERFAKYNIIRDMMT